MLETPFYIACLRLTGRHCLVVGGGDDRAREGRGPARLRRRRRPGRSRRDRRARRRSPPRARSAGSGAPSPSRDLEGKFMAIAATDDTDVNIAVYEDAERRAMLVNVVDVPPLCNFILPAIVRTGPLAIAISTAGASPALAKRMKREIAESFGEPYARLAMILNDARGWAKGTLPTYQDRKAVLRGDRQRRPRPDRAAPRGPQRRGGGAGRSGEAAARGSLRRRAALSAAPAAMPPARAVSPPAGRRRRSRRSGRPRRRSRARGRSRGSRRRRGSGRGARSRRRRRRPGRGRRRRRSAAPPPSADPWRRSRGRRTTPTSPTAM